MSESSEKAARSQFHGMGAAFYPEHHPEATWPDYVDLLAGAGLSAVRIGEFAWNRMEPQEGRYDFTWLDRFFALLERQGIQVLLCTPTAVPPLWAVQRYPEILPVMEDGRTFVLKPGMSYQVADNAEAHRSSTPCGAKLFIVD